MTDVPLVACFLGDAVAVLDEWSSRDLHASWERLRNTEHIAWCCLCGDCRPDSIHLRPLGPTSHEIAACVFAHRRRGEWITDEQAREELLADTEPS